jgi:Glycosyltransferase family 10 (fucosyltransferase) C-term
MNEFTVAFLTHHYGSNQDFLDTLLKMTPGRSGKWKEMTLITDADKADFCVVVDGYSRPFPAERTLFFGQHPKGVTRSYRDFKGIRQLASYPLDDYLNPGEWWIPYDYDTLIKMDPPKKEKNVCCCVAYHKNDEREMYRRRIYFMRHFAKKSTNIDLYGRPEEDFRQDNELSAIYRGCIGKNTFDPKIGEHFLGKEVVGDYRYSIEFDVGKTINYISERVYDAMLLWTMPIYFGSTNVEKFLPENSFRYVDIDNWQDENEIQKTIDIINSDFREQHIDDIAQARDLMLNKYQSVAYAYEKIKSLK